MGAVKVALIGPSGSCKTILANFLADATETVLEEHQPTKVVRILEFESNVNVNNRNSKADIELWDCSGDRRYADTYPALIWELQGVIFVFNPDNDGHRDELDFYYDSFIRKSKLSDSNAIVFALNNSEANPSTKLSLSKNFARIPQLEVSLKENSGLRVRNDFQRFIGTLMSSQSERLEQVEMNIMRG